MSGLRRIEERLGEAYSKIKTQLNGLSCLVPFDALASVAYSGHQHSRSECWWRRGESNPRPKAIHLSIYIHSPAIKCSPPGSLPGEVAKGLTWLSFASPTFRSVGSATLLSGVLINPAGVDQRGRWPLSGHGVRIIVCVCV